MSDWPVDYDAESLRRLKIYHFIKKEENWKGVRHHYAENPVDWINDFAITYDPRIEAPRQKKMPFVLFPRQVELVIFLYDCVKNNEPGLIEKCRDMGASWVCVAFSSHQWLFNKGSSIGWGSRKQELVDRIGDPDSIFEKIRMTLFSLPPIMLPVDFNPVKHASFMKIINPSNGASITGEAGDNIGRGGRKMMYFKDESAHYERPEKIEAALSENTNVQIDISSVNGTNNIFHRRRMAGEVWTPNHDIRKGVTRVFIMDWRDHPNKTEEWYEQKRKRAEEEGLLHVFAQEVDRDYESSVQGIAIKPEWVNAAIDAHIKLGIDDDGEKISALDLADEGMDKHALASRYGVVLKHASHWSSGDGGQAAQVAIQKSEQMGIWEVFYDADGVGAAAKTEYNRQSREGMINRRMKFHPWKGGYKVQDPEKTIIRGDKDTPKNKDHFENLKAQSFWRLAQRFEKTFLAVTKGYEYDHGELISIPSDLPMLHEIKRELCQPTYTTSKKGKMMVDKKPDGARSPNLADAINMCYNPVRKGVDYNKLVTM